MLRNAFPDLQWLKTQADSGFADGKGWPSVILNVKTSSTLRDNIRGPLSLFSNVSGESHVTVDNQTKIISDDYFFISNQSQRYTLEIAKNGSAETFNIHFGESWLENIIDNEKIEFVNKLYPKDDVVRYLQAQLKSPDKTNLEREELLTRLMVHLLRTNRNEKIRCNSLDAMKLSTRQEILRRLYLVTDYIYSFYYIDISLDKLAKISLLSKFHFIRNFKQAFGIAPHQFVNMVRIEKAKALLKTDLDIGIIAKTIGIKDASSFSRLFKNQTGIYPTAFRKT